MLRYDRIEAKHPPEPLEWARALVFGTASLAQDALDEIDGVEVGLGAARDLEPQGLLFHPKGDGHELHPCVRISRRPVSRKKRDMKRTSGSPSAAPGTMARRHFAIRRGRPAATNEISASVTHSRGPCLREPFAMYACP